MGQSWSREGNMDIMIVNQALPFSTEVTDQDDKMCEFGKDYEILIKGP